MISRFKESQVPEDDHVDPLERRVACHVTAKGNELAHEDDDSRSSESKMISRSGYLGNIASVYFVSRDSVNCSIGVLANSLETRFNANRRTERERE